MCLCMYIYTCLYGCACKCGYMLYVCVYVYVCLSTCIYMCICICVYVYIYAYVCIYSYLTFKLILCSSFAGIFSVRFSWDDIYQFCQFNIYQFNAFILSLIVLLGFWVIYVRYSLYTFCYCTVLRKLLSKPKYNWF